MNDVGVEMALSLCSVTLGSKMTSSGAAGHGTGAGLGIVASVDVKPKPPVSPDPPSVDSIGFRLESLRSIAETEGDCGKYFSVKFRRFLLSGTSNLGCNGSNKSTFPVVGCRGWRELSAGTLMKSPGLERETHVR